jgi:undecaprenyl-diphosphatase
MTQLTSSARWTDFFRRRRVAVVHVARLMVAVGLFLYVAHEVQEGNHFAMEKGCLRSLHTTGETMRPIGPSWLPSAARGVTAMGGIVVLSLVVGLVAAGLAVRRRYGAAVFLVVTALGGFALNEGLKQFYGRARPDPAFRWVEVESLSFPSGHAMMSAVVYLTLVVLLTRDTRTSTFKVSVVIAALLLCILIGLSRIYLGVHYPTDVMGGWAAAVAWLEICAIAEHCLSKRIVFRAE